MRKYLLDLFDIVRASNHTKCVSLSNQKCTTQSTLVNLHPNEYSQEFHYNPFTVVLDKFIGNCSNLNHLSNEVCIPYKTEDLNLIVSKMIPWINESKTLEKHRSCEYKCKFDWIKCNSDQCWNKDNCWCECNKRHGYENDYVLNPSTYNCKNGKCLASIMHNSAIMYNEVIESYE